MSCPQRHWLKLFTSHLDAWLFALLIAAACLWLHAALTLAHLGLLLTLTATCWAAFAFNDYHDAAFDAQDPIKRDRNFFARQCAQGTPRSCRSCRAWARAGGGGTLAILALGYAPFGARGWLVLVVCVAALWAYSAPPVRLKSRPLLDLLMHAVFVQTFPYLACLFLIGASWTVLDRAILAALFLSSLAAQLEQQARDFEVDSRTDRNFATTVGLLPTVWLMRACSALFSALMLLMVVSQTVPLYLLPFGLIALPIVLHRFVRRAAQPRSQRLMMISLLCALAYLGGLWGVAWLRAR
jgi:1,4-dihydroxy-2-naphthoate octaprenyltransferase